MNYVDWIILALLGLAVLQGLWRGLISQLLDLAAFVVSLSLAFSFGSMAATRIDHLVALPTAERSLIGFVVVLLIASIVIRWALRLLGHIIPGIITASPINRLLGIIPAVALTVFEIALVLTTVAAFPQWASGSRAIHLSTLAPKVLAASGSLQGLINRTIGPKLPAFDIGLPR